MRKSYPNHKTVMICSFGWVTHQNSLKSNLVTPQEVRGYSIPLASACTLNTWWILRGCVSYGPEPRSDPISLGRACVSYLGSILKLQNQSGGHKQHWPDSTGWPSSSVAAWRWWWTSLQIILCFVWGYYYVASLLAFLRHTPVSFFLNLTPVSFLRERESYLTMVSIKFV